jgi:hypothetical protein
VASGVYLTLLAGPVVALPVPKPLVDALTSVEVTTSATGRSGFELHFTLSNRSPLQTLFLLTTGGPGVDIRVIIVVTVNGIPNVLMDGVMRDHEVQPGADAGHSTLYIKGEDLTAVMDLTELPGLPYPMPAEARVGAILAKYAFYGIVPLVVPSVVPDIPIPVERIPGQQGTDFAYLTPLAEKVGHVFYLDPGPVPGISTAYWGPQVKFGVPQPALNTNMDTWTNVEQLSFRYDARKFKLPLVTIVEPTTHVPIPIPIPPVTPLNPPLGLVPPFPTPPVFEPLTDTAKLDPGQALMIGMARASANADVVTGAGSLDVLRYGQVLKARQLVGVRGAGVAFDGLHYVDSVTHRITRGEYKQSFSLTRNALVSNTPVVPTIGF